MTTCSPGRPSVSDVLPAEPTVSAETPRKTHEPSHFRDSIVACLALSAVLCALLWDSLFGGKVLTQADALYQFAPWSAVAPDGFQPSNELLLDQSTGFLPWMDFQAERVREFELPLWNPYNYCGEPLVGTYQSAFYWPINWIYYIWPSWNAHAWMAFARLWFAGFFTFLFLRRLGMKTAAAAVGGLGYMLSGFMVAWLNHPHVSCALFLPAMLWMVECMLARPGPRGAALFGLLFGLQLLAGHLQTSLHLGIFTAAYAVFHLLVSNKSSGQRVRTAAWLAVGVLLGGLLAAPQILPFLEYLGHSQAADVFEKMETVGREGVTPAAILMLDPHYYGAPHTHDYTGPLGPNLNYNELIGGYVGRTLVILALVQSLWVGWRRKNRGTTFFFLGVVVLSGLVAFQVEPFYSFFDSIPRLRSTKLMRVLQFVAFGLAVLGAMGLDRMLRRSRYRLWVTVGVFCMIATEQLWFAHGYNPQVDKEILVPRTEVTDFLRREQGLHRVLGVDNTILKPNANIFYRISMVSGYDSMEDKNFADLALRMTTSRPEYPFISQVGAFNRVEAFPLMSLLGIRYFLSRVPLPDPLKLTLDAEVKVYENPSVMPRAFLARDVSVIEDPQKRLEFISSPGFDPWTAVLESTSPQAAAFARCDENAGACEVLDYQPRQIDIRVQSDRRELLILTDVWDAGWSAKVSPDGAGGFDSGSAEEVEIERVDHALRGVWVGPGESVVRFRYDPASTKIGLLLALLAMIGFLVLMSWRAASGASRSRRATTR